MAQEHNPSRREFVKKIAYTAPVIMSLNALPAFAKSGSYLPSKSHREHREHHFGRNLRFHFFRRPKGVFR